MAGHSQFKNIMHRKGAQDEKRAKVFARLAREISVAVKSGNDDPKQNPRLRNAIINARSENMPNDKINNAIQKGSNCGNLNSLYEIRYECYGPNGIAIIVETITDNKNRTASEIRTILSKNNGRLAESGAVSFNFKKVGELLFERNKVNAEKLIETAIEIGATDFYENSSNIVIQCLVEDFSKIRDLLEKKFCEPKNLKLIWKVVNSVKVDDSIRAKILSLVDSLEQNDDVQAVYNNLEV